MTDLAQEVAHVTVRSPSGLLVAQVEAQDFDLVDGFTWNMAGGKGRYGKYAATTVTIDGKQHTHYMHRLVAWAMELIPLPLGADGGRWTHSVDHANGDKLDNRRANLRLRSRSEQMLNTNDALRSTNKSGYRGVSYVQMRERFGKPWMAYVQHQGKSKNLGWYATVEEAAAARAAWDAAAST